MTSTAQEIACVLAELRARGIAITADGRVGEAAAAEVLGVTPRALRDWRRRGTGPQFTRLGSRVTYRVAALLDHVAAHTAGGSMPRDVAECQRVPADATADPPRVRSW